MKTVIGISGSLRRPSHTRDLIELALAAARDNGARVELLDLYDMTLPLFDPRATQVSSTVMEMRERMDDAHAFVIGTPEYQGSMSGALKNLFDYLYHEVNGKLFGCMVAAGTVNGTMALAHLHDVISSIHGWTLPYGVVAISDDFDESGHLVNPRIRDRAYRLGRDVAIYGELLYDRFTRDRIAGGSPQLGFAPWHAGE